MKQIAGSPVIFRSPTLMFLCLVFGSGWAAAQLATNSLTGHVEDSSGASMAGATITLLDAAGNLKTRTATNSAGQFSISGVLPGEYVLEAERKMFETSREQISVSAGKPPPDLKIVMKVSTRRESVDVVQQEGYAVMATTLATKTDTPILECPSRFK
jgi:Carboxypeptidase regulatory-like domain